MKISTFRPFLLVMLSFWILSCGKTEVDPVNIYLVEAKEGGQFSKTELASQLGTSLGASSSQVALFIRTGVKYYKITYKTKNTNGDQISASGALILPTDLNQESLALASYQHGTIFNETDAPSYFGLGSEFGIGAFLASTGYITCMPDYVGYGASKEQKHPYEHREGLAQPSVDFILAVKEFLSNQKVNWNNNLLLAGYSEGGYATMATFKMLEEKYKSELNVKAVSSGAGAYNKTKTLESFLTEKTSGEAGNNRSYMWVLNTYDRIYKLNRPLSSYYVEPYLSQVTKDSYLANISKSFDEILNPTFVKGLVQKTDTPFLNAVLDNDIYDWKPTAVLRLYHGTSDTYVPYLNSKTAYDAMIKRGAANVTLVPIDGGNHGSSISTFLLGTLDLFNKYKN